MVEETEQDTTETGTPPVEPINDNDEYTDLDFKSCFIKKNISVLKWLYNDYGQIAIALAMAVCAIMAFVVAFTLAIPYIMDTYSIIISYIVSTNPIVDLVILGLLVIPTYCFFWCINHRRKKRLEKQMLDKMECRLGNKE